jgi:hypothetical protein
MFEILKIKLLVRQPVPKISDKTLSRIINREYPDSFDEVKKRLARINGDSLNEKNRLSVAVLRLSNGDFSK